LIFLDVYISSNAFESNQRKFEGSAIRFGILSIPRWEKTSSAISKKAGSLVLRLRKLKSGVGKNRKTLN